MQRVKSLTDELEKGIRSWSAVSVFLGLLAALLIAPSAWSLPEEIEMDRYMLAVGKYVNEGDFAQAAKYLNKAQALTGRPPAIFHYYKAKVAANEGKAYEELGALERYVSEAGNKAEHYEPALVRITELEEQLNSDAPAKSAGDSAILEAFKQDKQADDAAYAQQMKELYLKDDVKEALAAHINQLLATHAYTGKRVKKSGADQSLVYSISITEDGQILLLEKDRSKTPDRITTEKTSVYGQNPFIKHECYYQRAYCIIKKPDTTTDWMKVGYDDKAAEELAQALSRLIAFLQGQGQ